MPKLHTTVGQLLVNEGLPEDLRDYDRVLDKKGVTELLREVATKYPEKYRDISHQLSIIGRRASQESGGNSFGLRHLRKSEAGLRTRVRIREKMKKILSDDNLTDDQRHKLIVKVVGREQEKQQEAVFEEALKDNNPLAHQIISGARGNKMNLTSLLGADLLYTDQRERVIPVPVLRSYSEGLTPAEYWAGAYGTRKGVMATKFATRDAGFLSKQMNQAAHRLVVVDETPGKPGGAVRGMPVDVDDQDSEGALLAIGAGDYQKNTVLTPKVLKHLKRQGVKRILVRSPIIGGSPEGGVYAKDVGIRERGDFPARGEQVGLSAVQSLTEPLSQAQLSAKHSGGVVGEEKGLSGFPAIDQLIQVPKSFKGGAAHSSVDGIVERVQAAPAGGHNVTIDGEDHYVGDGFKVNVKRGDRVEAGDVLSEGAPNPAIVVKYKGIGEGRRYFVEAMRRTMKDAGLRANRRNLELLSRGLINHVRLTEERDHNVPDDVIPYSTLEHTYKPRSDAQKLDPKRAVGKYLERPYLHYTIGTKVRPSMLKNFKEFSQGDIEVHDDPPPFEPEMIRGMYSLQHDPDWMTRMYGSGLKKSLLSGVHRGATSEELGTSFVPGLSRAVDFGRQGIVRSPELPKMASSTETSLEDLLNISVNVKQALEKASGFIKQAVPPPYTPQAKIGQPQPKPNSQAGAAAGAAAGGATQPPTGVPSPLQALRNVPSGGSSVYNQQYAKKSKPYSMPETNWGGGGQYAYGWGQPGQGGLSKMPMLGQFMPQIMSQLNQSGMSAAVPLAYGHYLSSPWMQRLTYGADGKSDMMTPQYGAVGYSPTGQYDESRQFKPKMPSLGGFG